jgi:hypothetical protein
MIARLAIAFRLVLDTVRPGPVRDRSARLSVLSVQSSPCSLNRRGKGGREQARIDAAEELAVKEILRTNDAVLVSAVEALLEGAYIPYLVLDQNMSVLEGSLGILPRRVLVEDRCLKSARRLLEDAGLARELRPDVG